MDDPKDETPVSRTPRLDDLPPLPVGTRFRWKHGDQVFEVIRHIPDAHNPQINLLVRSLSTGHETVTSDSVTRFTCVLVPRDDVEETDRG